VNWAHQGEKLQDILDGFIERFVLCSNCENPETVLVRRWQYFIFEFGINVGQLWATFCIYSNDIKKIVLGIT
jgi:translation initiation factor 2 beta subunit (eIF-2beta)/eIF-5